VAQGQGAEEPQFPVAKDSDSGWGRDVHLLTDFQGCGQRLGKNCFFVRDLVRYWIQVGHGDPDVVGKGPIQSSNTQDLAVQAMAMILLQAPGAMSASGLDIRHYPLGHKPGMFWGLDYPADKLVPECSGKWYVSGKNFQVSVAYSGQMDPDQGLVRSGTWYLFFLDTHLPVLNDGCQHVQSLSFALSI
jgi:hypothetical protein